MHWFPLIYLPGLSPWISYLQEIRGKSRLIDSVRSIADHKLKIKITSAIVSTIKIKEKSISHKKVGKNISMFGLSFHKNNVTEDAKFIVS